MWQYRLKGTERKCLLCRKERRLGHRWGESSKGHIYFPCLCLPPGKVHRVLLLQRENNSPEQLAASPEGVSCKGLLQTGTSLGQQQSPGLPLPASAGLPPCLLLLPPHPRSATPVPSSLPPPQSFTSFCQAPCLLAGTFSPLIFHFCLSSVLHSFLTFSPQCLDLIPGL